MKLFLKTIVLTVVMALFVACGSDFEWFPEANVAPKANAGANQSVVVGDTVTLDGSASSDPNKDKLTYIWAMTKKPSESKASLSSLTTVNPTFTADLAGEYVCSLTVNDGTVSSAAATVTVTAYVGNAPPVAKINVSNTKVGIGGSVDADGSGSTDANSDALTYLWTLTDPAGNVVNLSPNNGVSTSFTALLAGDYELKLTVSDGKGGSDTETVIVTAVNAPVAIAGPNQTVFAGETVTLNGSDSTAPNGGTLTAYTWTFTSPATGAPTLDLTDPVKPTFKAPATTVTVTYVISLIVKAGEVSSVADPVTVTVKPLVAPVAKAGDDKNVFQGINVTLDGKASTDSRGVADVDGNNLNYYWRKISGSCVNLTSFNGATLTVTTPNVGICEFGLEVSDKSLGAAATLSAVDKVLINVTQATGSITVTW